MSDLGDQLRWAEDVARAADRPRHRVGEPPTTTHGHAYDPALDAANPAFDVPALLRRAVTEPWRVVPDDLTGGWSVVVACDRVTALSHLDLAAGERAVATGCLSYQLAEYLASLHAEVLARRPGTTEEDP